jgi:sugar lactone lactonase YvrE
VLPGATSAEGIAAGHGTTFYAGDMFAGDIFRGDTEHGEAALFIDAPAGRNALGMVADIRHHLLFVAGGFTGQAYAYDIDTGEPVAEYQFGDPANSVVNDVALTPAGAWFTDSRQPRLYYVPIDEAGVPGPFRTLELTGPAGSVAGDVNLNGVEATPNGNALIVAHSSNGALYRVDPTTGTSSIIDGIQVPTVDGIVLDGDQLWAVQLFANRISRITLDPTLTAGAVQNVITSDRLHTPSTAVRFGDTLAVVNAGFDTGIPPTADQYEIVLVPG